MANELEIFDRTYVGKLVYAKLKEAGVPCALFGITEEKVSKAVSDHLYDKDVMVVKAHGETAVELHKRFAMKQKVVLNLNLKGHS